MFDSREADARLRIVDEHIAHEVAHRLDPLVATFGEEPEWHNKAAGEIMHGHSMIRGFYAALFEGFPDFDVDVQHKHVTPGAVIIEAELRGTHRGDWMGVAATGKGIRVPICAVFTFTPDDRVKTETVYFDRLTMLSQLGAVPLS